MAVFTSCDNCAKSTLFSKLSFIRVESQCFCCLRPRSPLFTIHLLTPPSVTTVRHFICLRRRKALFLITTNKNHEPNFTCPYLRIVLEYKWDHMSLLTCYGQKSREGVKWVCFFFCVCFQFIIFLGPNQKYLLPIYKFLKNLKNILGQTTFTNRKTQE